MKKPITLTRRYNADGSLSLCARGRVQIRLPLGRHSDAEIFAIGWFGEGQPQKWGRARFAPNGLHRLP